MWQMFIVIRMKKNPVSCPGISIFIMLAVIWMSGCIAPGPNIGPDTTAPTVSSTIPANAGTGVPINSAITAVFSEVMNPLTVFTVTFTLKQGDTPVSGTVKYSRISAVFVPTSTLAPSTPYHATVTTGVKDLAGNAMAVDFAWDFTTGEGLDTNAPAVTGTINADGATNVPVNTKVGATFSEAMDPLTVTKSTFTLKQGSTPVSGTITYSNVSAVFVPANSLNYNTVYTATITTRVKDLAGNALTNNYTWSWTTGKSTGHCRSPGIQYPSWQRRDQRTHQH